MLFAKAEFLPDPRSTTLDEVLPIGVGPEGELDDWLLCNAATMQFDETEDRFLDLNEALAREELHRRVKEQVAVLNV